MSDLIDHLKKKIKEWKLATSVPFFLGVTAYLYQEPLFIGVCIGVLVSMLYEISRLYKTLEHETNKDKQQ